MRWGHAGDMHACQPKLTQTDPTQPNPKLLFYNPPFGCMASCPIFPAHSTPELLIIEEACFLYDKCIVQIAALCSELCFLHHIGAQTTIPRMADLTLNYCSTVTIRVRKQLELQFRCYRVMCSFTNFALKENHNRNLTVAQ